MLHQPPPMPPTHSIKLMSGAEENRHYLRAFIHTYRDMPVLWDTSLRDYTNREKRAEAYQRLVPIYHYLKRDATVEDVKKKINTLRTNYRKELKVVETAMRTGTMHTPRCWTFQELDFLRNTEKFLAVNPTFKNEPSFTFNENSSSSAAFMEQHASSSYPYRSVSGQTPNITEMFHKSFGHVQKVDPLPPPPPPPTGVMHQPQHSQADYTNGAKRARQTPPCNNSSNNGSSSSNNNVVTNAPATSTVSTHNTDELLNIACEYLAGTYPEEESISRTWTHKLKRLPREQRLLAERFINEILFEAESNNLHRGSVQINNSFEPYVRFEEPPACHEEQDKSQSPSVHTSSESTPKPSAGASNNPLNEPPNAAGIRDF
ncbi:GH14980 [Drosophila grimshawi]|uniref:GH14980 n=2 Tax=Drosophila grimshawi TaxID=7222 RepID=B4J113_DROGR|nr:GH14980 [Drosophila grimshawi]